MRYPLSGHALTDSLFSNMHISAADTTGENFNALKVRKKTSKKVVIFLKTHPFHFCFQPLILFND